MNKIHEIQVKNLIEGKDWSKVASYLLGEADRELIMIALEYVYECGKEDAYYEVSTMY